MKFYTAAAYELFRKEVSKSTKYFAREKIFNKEYEVVHVKQDKKLPWGREKFSVIVCNEGERYDCECGLYQHFGMLCSHVIRVCCHNKEYCDSLLKKWKLLCRDNDRETEDISKMVERFITVSVAKHGSGQVRWGQHTM
jgi:hypothetical protein